MKKPLDSNGARIPGGSTCPTTGKRMWPTRREAKTIAKRANPGEHMSAYRCKACGWFHIGHIPQAVRTGELDRSNISTRPGAKR